MQLVWELTLWGKDIDLTQYAVSGKY